MGRPLVDDRVAPFDAVRAPRFDKGGGRSPPRSAEQILRLDKYLDAPYYVHRVPSLLLILVALGAALALISLGGGAYEVLVVDPSWPQRPDIIQPGRGGISRRRFWIPAHGAFELLLVGGSIVGWGAPEVRAPLLVALASHAVMRVWSLVDFIPKALAFERTESAGIDAGAARRWARRSLGRLPLDVVTCAAMLAALVAAARLG